MLVGNAEVVETLLQAGASMQCTENVKGYTPLLLACLVGYAPNYINTSLAYLEDQKCGFHETIGEIWE